MELKPGARFASAVCETEVVVVKASPGEVDLRCGGQPMHPKDSPAPAGGSLDSSLGEPTLLGKRYADEELGIEVLCTKAGEGALSIGDAPLLRKDAKPLPSSD